MEHRIGRALVSVFEKDGIVELCRTLAEKDIEILSSGGTARLLQEHGVPVIAVADYTGFPEMLDGRVKTLHPRVHGGILAKRDNDGHMSDLASQEIEPIDLVVVNLYPFEKTAATQGIGVPDVIEMIDVGGPAMVRAAAKNYAHVGVVVDPADYDTVREQITANGCLSDDFRLELSAKAFRHTCNYDSAVGDFLSKVGPDDELLERSALPHRLQIDFVKTQDLRYGENPHQRGAFYRDPLGGDASIARATQLQGKELSFNNILDFDAALGLAGELPSGACVIIKHGNPCGTALGREPLVAFRRALECDPVSAFGGVIAFNDRVDLRAAEAIAEHFFEGVVAPRFDAEARRRLAKKKKLRLLEVADSRSWTPSGYDLRRVRGGVLLQDWDIVDEKVRKCSVVSRRRPTEDEWRALEFAWIVAKHVKSNAIVYALPDRTVGIGAGQMSRVDSARIGVEKAQSTIEGTVLASDAFFPFRDGIDVAAKSGVRAVIQPGGSIRDKEVIEAADEHDLAMVFTGRRHFRH